MEVKEIANKINKNTQTKEFLYMCVRLCFLNGKMLEKKKLQKEFPR